MSADVELRPPVRDDPRPAEHFTRFHERVRARPPDGVYELCRALTVLTAPVLWRIRAYDSENVPNGPVILAPNHASFLDHFFCAAFLRRHVQFMAKSQLFQPGPLSWVLTHGGAFPVRLGRGDEEAFITAFGVLERGGLVAMYCEGGRSRTGCVGERARPGIGRLALESGAAVVPVAILGSHQVRNWKRGRFPRVRVRYGRPFRFERLASSTRAQQQEAADLILARIRALHAELERAYARRS